MSTSALAATPAALASVSLAPPPPSTTAATEEDKAFTTLILSVGKKKGTF